jgi:inositol transport system ATP-binding protein
MRALFGLDPYGSGQIEIGGKPVVIRSVKDSIAAKLVMMTEDRRRYGLVAVRSISENVTLSSLRRFIFHGWLHKGKEKKVVTDICGRLSVKAPSVNTAVEALSGGNQQKVVLAKWMLNDPDVLIMDEPTRGIDVGAKYEIYKLMGDLAAEGKALVIVSSELPELIGMCDRIYVMCKGEIAGELSRDQFTQEAIMRLATGIEKMAREAS